MGNRVGESGKGVVCPSCGTIYDSQESALEVLGNSGCCTNITCLEDLSLLAFDTLLHSAEGRRTSDRLAS